MTLSSHIHRIALTAAIGYVMLATWAVAAVARPIDDPALPNAPVAEPPAASSSIDLAVPIAFAVVVVLLAVGTYVHRARTSRRVLA